MDEAERRHWEKLLLVNYHKAEKRVKSFPGEDVIAVQNLMNRDFELSREKPGFLKYTIWDARVNFKKGVACREEIELLDKHRSAIKDFDKIVDAMMHLTRYLLFFEAHRKGADLLEAANLVGKHMSEEFTREELDEDTERLWKNAKKIN